MSWTEEEVRMSLANFDWQLQSHTNALMNKYGDEEFHMSNLLFKTCD